MRSSPQASRAEHRSQPRRFPATYTIMSPWRVTLESTRPAAFRHFLARRAGAGSERATEIQLLTGLPRGKVRTSQRKGRTDK